MAIRDDMKDAERKVAKGVTDEMQSIKENVVSLAQNIKEASSHKTHDAINYVSERVAELKETGTDVLKKAEARVKARPGQSIAIAFGAGLLARYLLGRRSS